MTVSLCVESKVPLNEDSFHKHKFPALKTGLKMKTGCFPFEQNDWVSAELLNKDKPSSLLDLDTLYYCSVLKILSEAQK